MATDLSCSQGHHWNLYGEARASGKGITCPSCGGPPTLESLGAPGEVAAAVNRLKEEMVQTAKNNLGGLILYGGLARGRFRAGKSDVNLVVLLKDVSGPSMEALSQSLHRAWRAAGVEPFILTAAEVKRSADVFAAKFLDIREYHVVLLGEDPFADLQISQQALRVHVEQGLRNLMIRMRRRYISVAGDAPGQVRVLTSMVRPLALDLAILLRLAGKGVPPEDRTAAIFAEASRAFDFDGTTLGHLAALRQTGQAGENATALYWQVLRILAQAVTVADRMEGHIS